MTTPRKREVILVKDALLRRQMCVNAARKMMRAQSDMTATELIQKLAKRGYTLSDLVHAKMATFPASNAGSKHFDVSPGGKRKVSLPV